MEKTTLETIIAVIIGILIGVFVASGFWLVKSNKISFFPKNNSTTPKQTTTPTPTVSEKPFTLEISEPKDQSIINSEETTTKVKTLPLSLVVLNINGQAQVEKADETGSVSVKTSLNEGLNEIFVTSVKESGESISKKITVVYEKK